MPLLDIGIRQEGILSPIFLTLCGRDYSYTYSENVSWLPHCLNCVEG